MQERVEEPWELKYDPRVRKRLEKIRSREIVRRIEESALRLKERPYLGEPLKEYPGIRSYRIGTPGGEYRIIYRPIARDRMVFVILVGSREEVYDLLKHRSS
ncbi:MAG: type II toxin-antitoxin system RelE family toxin [Candidatus Bipolaricaulia bacterium]